VGRIIKDGGFPTETHVVSSTHPEGRQISEAKVW